jgi:hypothetical protein
LDAESLGRKILAADPAFHRVLVLGRTGETLARVYADGPTEEVGDEKRLKEMLGDRDAVILGASSRAEPLYGRLNFMLLAYESWNVMLMYSPAEEVYLSARIPLSANAEYLYGTIEPMIVGHEWWGRTRGRDWAQAQSGRASSVSRGGMEGLPLRPISENLRESSGHSLEYCGAGRLGPVRLP